MRKSSCMGQIRRHFLCEKRGKIFTSRDFLIYGKRSNVDNAMCRLVKEGFIVRLARGVFMLNIYPMVFPTPLEMVTIKANAFGKQLRIHGRDMAAKYGLLPTGNKQKTFAVDGSTSRFLYRGEYLNMIKTSEKIMRFEDTGAGLTVRALCSVGKGNLQEAHIDRLSSLWNTRVERGKIHRGKAWMHAWIGDKFIPSGYVGPFGPGYRQATPQ